MPSTQKKNKIEKNFIILFIHWKRKIWFFSSPQKTGESEKVDRNLHEDSNSNRILKKPETFFLKNLHLNYFLNLLIKFN